MQREAPCTRAPFTHTRTPSPVEWVKIARTAKHYTFVGEKKKTREVSLNVGSELSLASTNELTAVVSPLRGPDWS